MSSAAEPPAEQSEALRIERIITEIRRNRLDWDRILAETEQRRIDAQRTQQEMRDEPLKFLLSGTAAAVGLVGAGVALGAFLVSRIH